MDEKKFQIGEFVKENKGKIIKGTLIVTGIIVTVATVKLLKDRGANALIENLNPEGLAEGLNELVGLEG